MANEPAPSAAESNLDRIRRTRIVTKMAMVGERAWPLVLPLVIVVALFLATSWFGLFRLAPDMARMAMLAAFALAGLGALYPLLRFRVPSSAEVDRRVEQANALEHAPVRAQRDRLTGAADDFSSALWREHQRRMAEKLQGL